MVSNDFQWGSMSDYMGSQINMKARKHWETQSCLSKLTHISVETCTHMHVSVYACKHVSCQREALDFYPREALDRTW